MRILTLEDKLKDFHGPTYRQGTWSSKYTDSCFLCKTRNNVGKYRHWSKGLCKSCYKRLSIYNRMYNYTRASNRSKRIYIGQKTKIVKEYKKLDYSDMEFDLLDIVSLLPRYNFKCAYCRKDLQIYDFKRRDAFQIEYLLLGKYKNKIQLIPICRECNCSKKNKLNPEQLERWAKERNIEYPFRFIEPTKKSMFS